MFYDESEIDPVAIERKLAENESVKRGKEMWDKGYLDGMEWAETNY